MLRFAAMLDLGGRQDLASFGAFIYSIPCRLSKPIVVVNAAGTRIGMPELGSLITDSGPPLSTVPRRIRSTPPSRQASGAGTAGTRVVREQLDLPLIGLREENAPVIVEAVDSEGAGFLPYGPLVSDWLVFLAERLTAEFLRDVEPKL